MIAYLAVLFLVRVLCLLPLRVALWLGRVLGGFVGSVLRIRRSVVMQNLRHVFGETKTQKELAAITSETYRQCGMMWVEVLRASGGVTSLDYIEYDPLDEMQALKATGKPVIIAQPHLGNFDLIAYGFAMRGFPLHTVMKKIGNARVNDFMVRTREQFQITVHVKAVDTARKLRKILAEGAWLGVLPDQRPRRNKGVEVSFLGQPARVFPGPALFHLELGARIVVGWDERLASDPRRHHGHLHPLPPYEPTGDKNADIQAVMQQIADVISEAIRKNPAQYFWFHRLWGKELAQEQAAAAEAEAAAEPSP